MEIKNAETAQAFVRIWDIRWSRGIGLGYLREALRGLHVARGLLPWHCREQITEISEAIGVLQAVHCLRLGKNFVF